MAKKPPKKGEDENKVHIEVESWQWESSEKRLTWKHWVIIAILLGVAIFFAFGFLIIASVLLLVGIVINIVLFLFKKLS